MAGVLALLFLHDIKTLRLLIASIECFFKTRGFSRVPPFLLFWFLSRTFFSSLFFLPLFGDVGGVALRPDKEDLPLETAESLSESSVLCVW